MVTTDATIICASSMKKVAISALEIHQTAKVKPGNSFGHLKIREMIPLPFRFKTTDMPTRYDLGMQLELLISNTNKHVSMLYWRIQDRRRGSKHELQDQISNCLNRYSGWNAWNCNQSLRQQTERNTDLGSWTQGTQPFCRFSNSHVKEERWRWELNYLKR